MGFFVLFMCMYVCMYAGMYVCMCMCTWPNMSTNHKFQKDTVVADIALRLGPDVGIFFFRPTPLGFRQVVQHVDCMQR